MSVSPHSGAIIEKFRLMRHTSHSLRLAFLCLILGGTLTPGPAAAAGAVRPNIVFIWADDLGYGDLGCYGHPRIETPHLDRLAQEGTRFTQFYVSHSVCSPSRASAITGQYPSRWNIYAHLAWLADNAKRGMPDWLDVRAPSLPRALQQAGYRTAHFGKWHLGGGSGRSFRGKAVNSPDAPPVAAYGFDETRVDFGNGPTWNGTEPVDQPHDTYPYEDEPWMTWSSRLLADASIDFIARHVRSDPHRPFLLNLWLKDPHVPLSPTDEMRQLYADAADEESRDYFAVVTHMDAQIGRLLAALDELGLGDDTLVLFTSDNGAAARQGSRDTGSIGGRPLHTAGSNGPLRGWKWHLHEGGIRVPLIVRWPARVPAGRVDATSVLNLCDFTPTFTRLAGAAMPEGYESDGVDMTDALLGKPFDRGRPMFWQNPTANRRGPVLAIRDGNWKLLMEPDGTLAELYDLEADPAESDNIAKTHPEIVERLTRKLRDWSRSLPPPLDRFGAASNTRSRPEEAAGCVVAAANPVISTRMRSESAIRTRSSGTARLHPTSGG
jgi:N-acetylgalactosamine-6-sulfatase